MDWRKSLWLSGGLVAAALGCMRSETGALVPRNPPPPEVVTRPAEKLEKTTKPGKPHPETLVAMGNSRMEIALDPKRDVDHKQWAQLAARDYQSALDLDPKYLPAHLGLAKALELSGDPDKAFAVYKKALKVAPKESGLWYELGMAQARAKNFPAALEALASAARLAPENPAVIKAYGFTLARAGRFDEGLTWLMKAMNESDAHLNLARMAQHLGQGELCSRHLQLAVQLNPQNEAALEYLTSLRTGRGGEIMQAGYEQPVPGQ